MTASSTLEMIEVSTSTSSTQFNRVASPTPSANLTSLTSPCSQDNMIVDIQNNSSVARKESMGTKQSGKSLPSSSKTPRSSSVTKFHNRSFKIHTCCGILELNCLKVTSILALSISLFAFLCLVVIIALNYAIVSNYHSNLESLQTDATYYRELMKMSCRVAAVTDYNRTLSLQYVAGYRTYYTKYYEIMEVLIVTVPENVLYWKQMNMSRLDVRSRKAVNVELSVMDMVNAGNYTQAQQAIDSVYYNYLLTGYQEEVQSILNYVIDLKQTSATLDLTTTTIALIILCVSLVIVIPVIIAFVALSVKKDTTKEKQLRQVKKYMLMDTINDAALSEKFKEFCKQERSEENYALLEKINDYKKLSDKSFDIQVFLYDTDVLSGSDMVSDTTTSSTEDSNSKKKKKKGYTEKDLFETEKKKFEIAFEIYTDYLDVRGDKSVNISKQFADNVKQFLDFFAKGENEQLPENLFESVESEMCVLMMDTHHRFKAFMEAQLKERKKILSTLKRKK